MPSVMIIAKVGVTMTGNCPAFNSTVTIPMSGPVPSGIVAGMTLISVFINGTTYLPGDTYFLGPTTISSKLSSSIALSRSNSGPAIQNGNFTFQ